MGIPIEKTFLIRAPADAVWTFLIDPYRVAGCLPGAAITERVDDQTYGGTIAVKVGPVSANYRGKLRFERLDAGAREAEISASGQETRGKGGADMRMKSRVVVRSPSETEVTVTSDVNVVGVLAQFGRGMIQDVSDMMFVKFTTAMRHELEGPASPADGRDLAARAGSAAPTTEPAVASPAPIPGFAPPPASAATAPGPARISQPVEAVLDVGALGAVAIRRATARTLLRPGVWIALVVLGAAIYWLVFRGRYRSG